MVFWCLYYLWKQGDEIESDQQIEDFGNQHFIVRTFRKVIIQKIELDLYQINLIPHDEISLYEVGLTCKEEGYILEPFSLTWPKSILKNEIKDLKGLLHSI